MQPKNDTQRKLMAMNNKGKHAHMSHACVPDAYTQK